MFRPLRTLGLTDDERGAMRDALASHIAAHPVRMGVDDRLMGERSFWYHFVFLKPIPMVIPIVALIIALSGGTAFAAQGSLPGEVLYPVKIHVNEQVRVAFAVSDEAQAETQTALAAERLEEAAELNARGTLTAEVRDRIAERFARHETKAEARIAKLEAKGNVRAAAANEAALEEQLRIHAAILVALDVGVTEGAAADSAIEAARLAEQVRVRADAVAAQRAEAEARVERAPATESQQAAEGRKGAAEAKITEVTRFVARAEERGRVEAEVVTAAEAKIDAAKALVVEGDAKADAEAFGDAFVKFGEAQRAAQQAKLIVTLESTGNLPDQVRERLGIDVKADSDASATEDAADEDADEDQGKNKDEDTGAADRGRSADVRADTDVRADGEVRSDSRNTETRTDTEIRSAVNAILPVLP